MIWYDGKILYLPEEYFKLKNLLNVNSRKKSKCVIRLFEVNLIKELKDLNISFLLEENLAELLKRVNMLGNVGLSDNMAFELLDEKDYSNFYKPIYLDNGIWINIEKE